MKTKDFFLISKILFQKPFIWWLLISLAVIPISLLTYGKSGANFTITISVIALLSLISGGSVQMVRNFPLQPYIKRYVLLTAMVWMTLFSYLFWQIGIVGKLIKLDPITFLIPVLIPLMLTQAKKLAKKSILIMIFVWLMRIFILSLLNAILYKYVGDSFIYIAIMLILLLSVIHWQTIQMQ